MGLSNSETVGKAIATALNQGENIKQDAIPAEIINSMLLAPTDRTRVVLSVTGTRRNYGTTSFILDHPIYGELDSSTLSLDGGYAANAIQYVANAFSYPGTYTGGSSTIFTYTS